MCTELRDLSEGAEAEECGLEGWREGLRGENLESNAMVEKRRQVSSSFVLALKRETGYIQGKDAHG